MNAYDGFEALSKTMIAIQHNVKTVRVLRFGTNHIKAKHAYICSLKKNAIWLCWKSEKDTIC